ncbi:transmembrane prolyl 4-hydroxylase-like isoform X2 [Actinia tenebrosa]|nr:transmembrane prolyl 4-hydroxylase-like isoform X2 [Actinia tenebrosa]XP_031555650.1 transmembrane prolyl 4-hydroxylase-like isoform X2 [Actinia tenebrosa]XP_031555651.1 transmembrane prolyl 4-hydroxylase-like isoform X2 [Actinia tenebrosa]
MVLDGPCVIRRTRLPRLDGIKVGHVQPIQLTSNTDPHLVKTISLSPPIFEIPDFLSEEECDKLIKLANSHMMQTSDIINPGATLSKLDYDTTFSQWDRNGDKLIDKHEIFAQLLYLRDMHFTDKDIDKMLQTLKIGQIKKGFIHPKEFQGKKLMGYIDQVRLKDPKVIGRHSNETWLDMWEDDILRDLNFRKAALTGLPLEVIEGSETPVVIKYGKGGHYHCHYDSHSPVVIQPCCHRSSQDGCRVCRYITIMYFLSDVETGGQTAFPIANNITFNHKKWHQQLQNFSNLSAYCSKANIIVTPKKGKAVMWYNHVVDKSTGWLAGLDQMSYHGGCDVIRGEKWIMNNWINIIGQNFGNIRTWNDTYTKLHIYKDHLGKYGGT